MKVLSLTSKNSIFFQMEPLCPAVRLAYLFYRETLFPPHPRAIFRVEKLVSWEGRGVERELYLQQ